ncbi:MAG: hypothetical protein HY341_00285 [Candidatus Kerfeldbacteria bacterium]|nr:hypothetical protein [Candidatus Kerfeldbacteria bacterium]
MSRYRRRHHRMWCVIGLVGAVGFLAMVVKVNHVMDHMIAKTNAYTILRAAQTFAHHNGGHYPSSFTDEDQEGCTLLDYLPRGGLENPFTGTWDVPCDGSTPVTLFHPGAMVYAVHPDGCIITAYDDDGDAIVVLYAMSLPPGRGDPI